MNDDEEYYLKVKVDGPSDIPIDVFRNVINGMSEIASEVDRALDEKGRKAFRWDIKNLEYGSALYAARPVPTRKISSERELAIARTIREGLDAIQSRQKQRPPGYTDKACRLLRGMITGVPKNFTLEIGAGQKFVSVNYEAVAQIDEWLAGRYEAFGSVEGRLDRVSSHSRLEFTIYDEHENKIDCFFSTDMKDKVKEALYGDVSVRGRIVYRADGIPVSVYPVDVNPLAYENPMDLRSFMGVLDLDVRSEDYVRGLRDE